MTEVTHVKVEKAEKVSFRIPSVGYTQEITLAEAEGLRRSLDALLSDVDCVLASVYVVGVSCRRRAK